jgi:hypothetical protein
LSAINGHKDNDVFKAAKNVFGKYRVHLSILVTFAIRMCSVNGMKDFSVQD